ncbi:MAG: methionine ABC transporter ATP-binding protein [Desulfovibrio sp.]|nr:methionine ABC transporter ATP-binding protein [Desulfovibrio sp.]
MITIEKLQKFYGARQVLHDISMHVKEGEIFGIVGHSGAGKSTVLRCMNGLEPYQGGKVLVNGVEVSSLDGIRLRTLQRGMGMIFQNFNLMMRKNVFDNVAFPLRLWGEEGIDARVNELLDLVGLTNRARQRVQSLSGGQKQRVGIARALALNPPILLCDEATSALDPKTTMSILDLLDDINRSLRLTIVMVTHQMEVVKRLCHSLLMLDRGKMVAMGNTAELFLSPTREMRKMVTDEFAVIPGGVNIRLMFPKAISLDCVITRMARSLDIDFSIVGGKLERYLDDVFGFLIINVPKEQKERVFDYLEREHLYWQELDLMEEEADNE